MSYQIQFLDAKNNEQTVKINNSLLHSMYSPSKEAERFVENLNFSFNPKNIFIIEPGLGYCLPYLHQKFPSSQIVIIRFINEFVYSENYITEINFNQFSSTSLFENYLYSSFLETDILQSCFISWPASEKIFSELNNTVWNCIKNVINQSKTVLYTRGFFENRWLKNTIINLTKINKYVTIKNKISKDVLIVASGSSLNDSISLIKKNKEKFFIICVSSAIEPLVYNNIIPDLCISSDGGYWAKKHLEAFNKIKDKSIIALPMEAACQKELLENSTILPLTYEDGLCYEFEKLTDISFFKAYRNGTVSGTALCLAKKLSDKNIYFAGLDLHSNVGFQHQKPNRLEIEKFIKNNKLKNISSLCINSEFNSGSLLTYENWFKVQLLENVYRIIDNPKNHLGQISDISSQNFEKICSDMNCNSVKDSVFSIPICIKSDDKKIYIEKFIQYVNANSSSENWIKNEFPLDFVSFCHAENDEKQKIMEKIQSKNKELVQKLKTYFQLV